MAVLTELCHVSPFVLLNYCYILFSLENYPMTMDCVEKNIKERKYSEDFL